MTGITYPNLPTDTLYKFLSVFGLIILVVSFIIPSITLHDNFVEKYKLTLSYKDIERNRDDIEKKIVTINKQLHSQDFIKTNTIVRRQKANGVFIDDSSGNKNFNSTIEKKETLIDLINKKSDSLMITKKQLENLYATEKNIITYCNNGILLGFVLSILGFILWYVNNQVYQDLALKIQSGYKILPLKENKTKKEKGEKTEDEKSKEAWKQEIDKNIFKFLFILAAVLVGVLLIYNWIFPNGFFESEKIEIIYVEK